MTERLSDVEAQIGSIRQLSAVVTAMQGIAAARAREAAARIDGVRTYAATVGTAIGEALALLQGEASMSEEGSAEKRHLLIALCSEQGFVGAFNFRILDAAERVMKRAAGTSFELLLVGDRGIIAAEDRGVAVAASLPMAAHADEVTALANRIAERLLDLACEGRELRVTMLHAAPDQASSPDVVEKILLPFDYSRFPPVNRAIQPLITQPAAALLAKLTDEYVFAELCEALLFSHAAENEARMRAMVAARDNVGRKLDELGARARLLRQEEITSEVIELAADTRL